MCVVHIVLHIHDVRARTHENYELKYLKKRTRHTTSEQGARAKCGRNRHAGLCARADTLVQHTRRIQ
jgi:hypothetical protein